MFQSSIFHYNYALRRSAEVLALKVTQCYELRQTSIPTHFNEMWSKRLSVLSFISRGFLMAVVCTEIRDSIVGVVTRLRVGWPRIRDYFLVGQTGFLSSPKASTLALCSSQPHVRWETGADGLSSWPFRQCSSETKNEWSYLKSYIGLHGMHRSNCISASRPCTSMLLIFFLV
jgi:hypothetical protein